MDMGDYGWLLFIGLLYVIHLFWNRRAMPEYRNEKRLGESECNGQVDSARGGVERATVLQFEKRNREG